MSGEDIHDALYQRDLRGRRVVLSGTFWLTPQRTLKRHLRAMGAIIPTSPKRTPRLDALFFGDSPDSRWLTEAGYHQALLWSEAQLNEELGLMLETAQRMGLLRALCHEPEPTPTTWRQICAVLEFWPTYEPVHEAIEYVSYFVDQWSKEDRRGLPVWYKRERSGYDEPRLTLCCAES